MAGKKRKQRSFRKRLLFFIADSLVLIGVVLLVLIFSSPFFQEIKFRINKVSGVRYQAEEMGKNQNIEPSVKVIIPESTDFGIVIPKIDANAKIFPNIDPFDKKEFLPVLKKGVAHAKGTSFPGSGKNIYLFAHSTDAFFNAGRYNAVFYLIGKLEKDDEIDIYYKNKMFKYSVYEKKVVGPQALEYLKPEKEEILTLQTCYPPGTTLRRLIVKANRVGK